MDNSAAQGGARLYESHVQEFLRLWQQDKEKAFARFGTLYVHSLPPRDRQEMFERHGWIKEGDPDAIYNQATTALHHGDHTTAVDLYSKVLEIDPTHYEANYNMAILRQQEGDVQSARVHAHRALERAPDSDMDDIHEFLDELEA